MRQGVTMFSVALVFVAVVTGTFAQMKACKIDLVMVVDRSGSIGIDPPFGTPENWDLVKEFLSSIISLFEIGPEYTQVGLVAFDNKAVIEFTLDQYNKDQMTAHVDTLFYDFKYGGRTNTDAGLRTANDYLFTPEGGDRLNTADVILLITDGKASPAPLNTNLDVTIEEIKSRGINIICVGVTDQIDKSQLEGIVTSQGAIYAVRDFPELAVEDFITNITLALCRPTCSIPEQVFRGCDCTRTCRAPDPFCYAQSCYEGCFCPQHWPILDETSNTCVAPDQCTTDCDYGLVYSACSCTRTCLDAHLQCSVQACYPGCFCPPHTPVLVEFEGKPLCITADQCIQVCPAPTPKDEIYAFSAYSEYGLTLVGEGDTLVFEQTFLNFGSAYSTTSGRFTCPCNGIYRFDVTISGLEDGLAVCILKEFAVISPLAYVTKHGAMGTSALIDCYEGEQVWVQVKIKASTTSVATLTQSHLELSLLGFIGKLEHTIVP